jgi:hypothetical protein
VAQILSGRLSIQTVRHAVQPPEMLPAGLGADYSLAIIAEDTDVATLQASMARFLTRGGV